MVGVGSVLVSTRRKLYARAMTVSLIIEKGDNQSIDQLDATMDNNATRDLTWPMTVLEPGQTLWLPYGWCVLTWAPDNVATFVVTP